ncbi:DNA/RNA nuclease SfsA [candidate division KSB1 bacterium]|nr:DNA/RNA nuclease SfsA [candidate division KSB1 bacterium]
MRLPPLKSGILLRRYKRFLADVVLADGLTVQAHCPNSGSMLGCQEPGSHVLLSYNPSPKRKYPYTWELVQVDRHWVGINTQVPNRIVKEAIVAGRIPLLSGYPKIKSEVRVGERSRLDLFLSNDKQTCFVEIKNVSLVQDGIAYFPDAVTERGARHLLELQNLVSSGARGIIFFVVQRGDAQAFRPAWHIDPHYARVLLQSYQSGVEVMAYQAAVNPLHIALSQALPFQLNQADK